jgi:hypothetical protein
MDNFKIGDEVICVNIDGGSRNKEYLTLGKIYKVISLWSNRGIVIIDDSGYEGEYFFHRFKKANKIKQIKVYGISLFCESLKRR